MTTAQLKTAPVLERTSGPSARQKLLALCVLAVLVQGAAMLVTNLHPVFCGTIGTGAVTDNLGLYSNWASRALHGEIPYRDYVIEYPFLAFFVFLLPRFFAPNFAIYRVTFSLEMLFFSAWAVYLVARRAEREGGISQAKSRLAWYTVFFALLCPLSTGRYDLAPMALAFAAADCWFSGRPVCGGLAAGCGALMKIFPGAVAAPALVWEAAHWKTTRGRGFLTFVISAGLAAAAWFALGGKNVTESLRYHTARGFEVESLYAGAIYLAGKLTGREVGWVYNFGGFHVVSPWADGLKPWAFPVQAATMLLVMWRFWRTGLNDGVRYAGAAILAFIISGKVLSPQFMIWLFPFIALLSGPGSDFARRLFLLCCVVTTLIYPFGYFTAVLNGNLWAIVMLNLRNAMLVVLLGVFLFAPRAEGASRSASLSPSGEGLR